MIFRTRVRARRRRRRGLLALVFLLAVLAFLFYDSTTRLVTEEFTVSTSQIPDSFNGFRIVQLSDVHGKSFGPKNSKLIEAVREAAPDIIVITGDFIDNATSGEWAKELLNGLVSIAPVYFVTGNHEWASGGLVGLFEIMDDCGVKALRNEYVLLERDGRSIVLAGVDDPNGFADQKTPQELFSEIEEEQGDKYKVLLAHRNNMLDIYAETGANLVLTGHCHGGIIRLPALGGLLGTERNFFPEYESGFYIRGATTMFVSRGIGLIFNIPRFLNNPQVAVLILQK
mgnify:CR=1 FL=1|jgi:predicted MPP superfamily phosphohydrolase